LNKLRGVSIDAELRRGERILWVGYPQGSLLAREDAYLIPASLGVLIFVVSFAAQCLSTGIDLFALAAIAPLISGALYWAVLRFL
jgi:hypothetical protein